MSTAFHSQEAQKLKVMRSVDGQVSGYLQCTVTLSFSAQQVLSFADALLQVPVSEVLNPLKGTFLADEMQRLMRLGLAAWLELELCQDRVHALTQTSADGVWDVHFKLPSSDGQECDLHVEVAADIARNDVPVVALNRVHQWCQALDARAPDEWVRDVLAEVDLHDAPRLRCGLTRVGPTRLAASDF